jgi:sigma-B regulation protein RsbU (phosphoserine phosphatase)
VAEQWRGIRISVEADPKYLEPLRAVLSESTTILGLGDEVTANIVLAVTEACANIIRHCYGGRPGERIDLEIRFADDHFELRIIDYGEFVDPADMKGRDLDDVKPGGLGLHFIHTVMDDVEYRKNRWGGTTLILRKQIEAAADEQDEFGFDVTEWDESGAEGGA